MRRARMKYLKRPLKQPRMPSFLGGQNTRNFLRNCWYCKNINVDTGRCSKSVLPDVSRWRRKNHTEPFPARDATGCPSFELSQYVVKENRFVTGERLPLDEHAKKDTAG